MKKKTLSKVVRKQLATFKTLGCFNCNGTQQLCNICGEASNVYQCPEEEQEFIACPDCKPKTK